MNDPQSAPLTQDGRGTPRDQRPVRSEGVGEATRTLYVLARTGIVGLVLWLNRQRILDWLANWLTGGVAIGIIVAAVVITGAANRLHKNHRAAIVTEKRYSLTTTKTYAWPHYDLRVRRPLAERPRGRDIQRAAPAVWFVGFGDSIVHQLLMTMVRIGQALVLLTPLSWLAASVRRSKLNAWRLEHGEGTPAYHAARAADERRERAEVTRDDWLVDPPWRRKTDDRLPPRFGRKPG